MNVGTDENWAVIGVEYSAPNLTTGLPSDLTAVGRYSQGLPDQEPGDWMDVRDMAVLRELPVDVLTSDLVCRDWLRGLELGLI